MEFNKDKITIFDVAKAAEVSISTVSRVMNGNYPVRNELRDRVNKAVSELGYMPDLVARGMKGKRRYAIGLVVSDITNRHFTVISKAIEDILGPLGYSLIVCNTNLNKDREEYAIKMLLSNRVDAIIINTTGKNDEYIASISHQLPVILLHRRIDTNDFAGDYVGSDNFLACAHLAKLAIKAGHTDIGIITSDQSISTFRERTKGFIETADNFGVRIDARTIIETYYTEEGGYEAFGRLVTTHPHLSLVVVMNNSTAIGVYKYASEQGVAIPDTISILSFGEILNAKLMFVKPSFMTQQPMKVGEKVAQLILFRLDNPKNSSIELVVESQFVEGESLKQIFN